jgi:oxalate decarboxylase/phosphoglucose isomerase-like protein (cupin superfamily)
MRVISIRDLEGNRPVLMNPLATGPSPVYQVYSELGDPIWINRTEIVSGDYSGEYPKTFGHYHGATTPEKYRVVSGNGVLVLQKKHLKNGIVVPEEVEDILLIKANPGDELIISAEWGHSWSNVGNEALVLLDDWHEGHSPRDYLVMERLRGMAYYLIKEGVEITVLPNENYKNLPDPSWVSVEEFKNRTTRI